jgi:hypothetical protein
MEPAVRYSRTIRLAHAMVAVAIVFQMIFSLVMNHPHAQKPMT